MARKRGAAHGGGGGHGWFVTFADLMGLLVAFFVMLVAFSTPNQKKQQIVAGSMRESFGMQKHTRTTGIIETDGVPVRSTIKYTRKVSTDFAADQTSPYANSQRDTVANGTFLADRGFTTAAVSLRQALQEMPEIAEISRNVVIEETDEGLDIQIVDQDGRSMFPEGSALPYERTRKIIAAVAPTLRRMPNRIRVTGHISSGRNASKERGAGWKLSAERAISVRDILANNGVPDDRFESVVGRGDTQPVFPDDPSLAPNRRVSIMLVHEAPPLPPKK
ncbi:MAG: flagellar motor protein MotB [Beijerinckiaceae bacterium]|nr:flagellar motor protein MotB [Beijerinckiaceae bacterium]MCZ8300720.1 flagellar motor protein MotB [Beijerinckiaceae bacterium]